MTEEIIKDPEARARGFLAKVALLTSPAAVERIRQMPVTNDAEQDFAARLLGEIKGTWAELEKERTAITGPMNKALRATNDLFRPAAKALEHEEAYLKLRIVEYLEAKSQANTAALQLAAVAPTPELAQQAIQTVAPVAPPQGVSVRHVWKFEVTDANQVPREFCSPDEKKIKAAFELGMTDIPGVKFFQEAVVSARSG